MTWITAHWWMPLVSFWLLSWTLTTLQVRNYRNFIRNIRSESRPNHFLSTGVGKGWLRPGCVAVLITNHTGMVVQAYSMRGWSVFARFQPWSDVEGHYITEWELLCHKKASSSQKALRQAAALALSQYQPTESDAEASR